MYCYYSVLDDETTIKCVDDSRRFFVAFSFRTFLFSEALTHLVLRVQRGGGVSGLEPPNIRIRVMIII